MMSTVAAEATLATLPGGQPLATGRDSVRAFYQRIFARPVRITVKVESRVADGAFVVDHERFQDGDGKPQGQATWIYHVTGGLIRHAWVLRPPPAGAPATSATSAPPESAGRLVGTWRLVSVDNLLPEGTRVQLYGPTPAGLLMFDAGGRYALEIMSAGRPGFASKDKSRGTPEEYRAAVQGSNAHFGTYSVDTVGGTVTFRIERASFPNWEGTEQRRPFTLVGDRLTYTVPAPTSGSGAVGEVVWRRADDTGTSRGP